MTVEFPTTTLIRPIGTVPARWLGAIGSTGEVHIRYWQLDSQTARNKPVVATACYCPTHCILYLNSDYPTGCPHCKEGVLR